MKKVALITIHRISNCGSLLQTWATIQMVERLGCACTLVDYAYPTLHHFRAAAGDEHRCARLAKLKWILRKVGLLSFARSAQFLRRRFGDLRKTKLFYAAVRQTERCNHRTVRKITGYDVYLTGSDQTWNPRYMADDHSFLWDFTPDSARRISYAASFGCQALPQQYQADYGRLLARYSAISVREPSGVSIVRNLCGKEAIPVVDPTLLMKPSDYACLTGSRLPSGKRFVFCYVLTYVFDAGDWAIKLAAEVAQAKALSVIFYAGDPVTAKRAQAAGFVVRSDFLPVADFLEYYAKAEFVITTSFHGTAFSLNYRKNFYSIINPNASADDRVVSFLERFGLSHRGVLPGSDVDKLVADLSVDYSNADRLLAEEREKSLDFLKQALGGEK